MTKAEQIAQFDPNGVGLKNGHFIGLPFTEETASVVLLSVPWDVTVSFGHGTASGPANILAASAQLDLFDPDIPDAWKIGLYLRPAPEAWKIINKNLRGKAEILIEELEFGEVLSESPHLLDFQKEINEAGQELKQWVYKETKALLDQGKKVGIVGGEHSVSLGYLTALAERYPDFGVLQIDAHQDLRKAYESFTHSHASIFYNALQLPQISKLVQVGIRDYCEEETEMVQQSNGRIAVFYDQIIRESQYTGKNYDQITDEIISELPQHVYISFDIDGLDPKLCPATGTPVPGGLELAEAFYLLKKLKQSGRKIIGFDLCEVGGQGNDWDGNVGARVLYRLANWLGVRDEY